MNEVRVYDASGNLKKTITAKELNTQMWKRMGVNINMKFKVETRECLECKKVFTVLNKFQKYCKPDNGDDLSRDSGESKCAKAAYRRKLKVPQMEKTCQECGASFMGSKSRVFCQDPCKGVGKSEGGPIPARPCAICKKIYQPKSNRGKFCGDPCSWYDTKPVKVFVEGANT